MGILTQENIRQRLAAAMDRTELYTGDIDLNPGLAALFSAARIPAAVMILLVERGEDLTVVLTKRHEKMRVHAGQISFPGGHTETADASPLATALRETEEEIGIKRSLIEPLGFLPDYQTRTGFTVSPVVGFLRPPFTYTPKPDEVEEIFEVPLSFILNSDNCRLEERSFNNITARFYSFDYENHKIWGATAGMLRGFATLLSHDIQPSTPSKPGP
jgi:8-oxo-dGTP pyrophosphatase MutT (NUDIX family)